MAIELVLILEDELNIEQLIFYSGEDLETYLNTTNNENHIRKNILFHVDDVLNYKMSDMYRNRYLV